MNLKAEINHTTIALMAKHFCRQDISFNTIGFVALATEQLEVNSLKARISQVATALGVYLPKDFQRSAEIILASLGPELGDAISGGQVDEEGIGGWLITSLTEFVARFGQTHFVTSMQLLKALTKRQTAEFDMRFFLINNPEKTLATLIEWTQDPCHHVRRLVSEATRPRLPWGVQLKPFIACPDALFPLLAALKDDESAYVRRSVANNLNDISKDHPQKVIALAKLWWQPNNIDRMRLLKKACRTLIKQRNREVLSLMGYTEPLVECQFHIADERVKRGEALDMTISLTSLSVHRQSLLIYYILHYRLKSSRLTSKVFTWRQLKLEAYQQNVFSKQHPFLPLATRRYYPGEHKIEIIINGECFGYKVFQLET